MDIVFKSRKIEKEFNDERALQRERGDRQARLIMRRLAELSGAETLEAMRYIPGPRCHELRGNLKGRLSVDLDHPYRLIFVPDHDETPTLPDGGMDWKQVKRIKILGVENTHE
jgi:plasmid maintenance system killer protein